MLRMMYHKHIKFWSCLIIVSIVGLGLLLGVSTYKPKADIQAYTKPTWVYPALSESDRRYIAHEIIVSQYGVRIVEASITEPLVSMSSIRTNLIDGTQITKSVDINSAYEKPPNTVLVEFRTEIGETHRQVWSRSNVLVEMGNFRSRTRSQIYNTKNSKAWSGAAITSHVDLIDARVYGKAILNPPMIWGPYPELVTSWENSQIYSSWP